MRKGDKGMPRKDCPARLGKVKLRNRHWREIKVIDAVDERGNPKKWHYVSEPLIVEKRVRRAREEQRYAALVVEQMRDPVAFAKKLQAGMFSAFDKARVLGRVLMGKAASAG